MKKKKPYKQLSSKKKHAPVFGSHDRAARFVCAARMHKQLVYISLTYTADILFLSLARTPFLRSAVCVRCVRVLFALCSHRHRYDLITQRM